MYQSKADPFRALPSCFQLPAGTGGIREANREIIKYTIGRGLQGSSLFWPPFWSLLYCHQWHLTQLSTSFHNSCPTNCLLHAEKEEDIQPWKQLELLEQCYHHGLFQQACCRTTKRDTATWNVRGKTRNLWQRTAWLVKSMGAIQLLYDKGRDQIW